MRGQSVESGFADVGNALSSAVAQLGPGNAPKKQQLPPPELTVSQPVTRKVVEWDEYTGRFDAVEAVEVRARISGYLNEVKFTDGEDVKAGDLLFSIDPRPFERALDQAKAQLDQATVSVSNAKLDVERGKPLLQRDYISKKAFDDRENLVREAESLVKIGEAPRQGRRARAELHPDHRTHLRAHEPHARHARQLRQRRRIGLRLDHPDHHR
ncbi:MAG: biotin/lipoyl-binding protein [Hyphomicrobium sp.]